MLPGQLNVAKLSGGLHSRPKRGETEVALFVAINFCDVTCFHALRDFSNSGLLRLARHGEPSAFFFAPWGSSREYYSD